MGADILRDLDIKQEAKDYFSDQKYSLDSQPYNRKASSLVIG
jgi:hypothetical protein